MGYESARDMQAVAKLLRKVDVNQTGYVTEAEFVRHFVNWRMADIADKLKEVTGQGSTMQVLAITWRTFEAVVQLPASEEPSIGTSASRRLPAVTVERVAVTRVTEYLTAWWNKHGSNPDVCLWLDVAGWDASFAAALGDALALHEETMADASIFQTQKVEALPATHRSEMLVAPAALALDAVADVSQPPPSAAAPPPSPTACPPPLSPSQESEAAAPIKDNELRAQLLVHLVSLPHVPLSRYDQQGDVLALLQHAWPAGSGVAGADASPQPRPTATAGLQVEAAGVAAEGPGGFMACCTPAPDAGQGGEGGGVPGDGEVQPACINSAALVACGVCWYMGCAPRCCHRALTAAVEPPLGDWVMSDAALPLGAGLWGKNKLLRHTPKMDVEQMSILVHSDRVMVTQRPQEEQPPPRARPPPPGAAAAQRNPQQRISDNSMSKDTTPTAMPPTLVAVVASDSPAENTPQATSAGAGADEVVQSVAPNRVKRLRRADHSTRALLPAAMGKRGGTSAAAAAPPPAGAEGPPAPAAGPAVTGGARNLWWRVDPADAFHNARTHGPAVSVGNVMDSLLCRLVCGDPSADPIRAMGAKSMAIELAEAVAQVNFSVRDRLLDWRNLLEAHIRHSAARHHVDHLYALGKVAARYTQQIAQMKRALRPEAFERPSHMQGVGDGEFPLSSAHILRAESYSSGGGAGKDERPSGGGGLGGNALGEFFTDEEMEVRELYDDHAFIHEDMSSMVKSVDALQQLYKTAQNDQMNRILFALTLVTTVMLPGQFLTGVYGMNFETGMYELELGWGYAGLFWGVVLFCGSAVAVLFVRRYWALL